MRVARWSGALSVWESELSGLKRRIGPVFGRREVRETAGAFLDGLLSGVERKTGWLLAEQAGLEHPTRMQALLGRTRWEADALRDQVRAYVLEALGDPDGVLVVDETGFVKKGLHSVGVARQYSGTAGRIESCQVGVFLAYASRFGQALIDRRLYLPESWAGDAERRAQASVPAEVSFATKPAIARDLVAAALEAGAPCAFVLADALYGSDTQLRRMLEERGQPYVLAVRSNHHLRFLDGWSVIQTDPATLADELSPEAWVPHAAGEGAKGLRLYDWARIPLPWTRPDGFERFLLVRRNRRDRERRAYYLVFCPAGTTLAELAGVAGLRWTIEECFQRAKDDLGLDHCEARSWHGWHRHISLVMAAAAFLARLAADLRRTTWDVADQPATVAGKANERSPTAEAA
jgi:SRSO17 transposase